MVINARSVIVGWLCFITTLPFCDADCDIIQTPKTTVALKGDNVTFFCVVEVDGSSVVFNDKFDINNNNRTEYGERGIYWESIGDPINTFYIYILANEVNNGTSLSCGSGACQTDKVYLIVVNAPPLSPDPPIITIINLTTLNISWSSPWTHPVNNYTLFIANNNTGITMNYTTVNTQYILYDEDNSECNVLEFTVSANTDVGNSGLSEKTVKGFPKSFHGISLTALNNGYEFMSGSNGKLKSINVHIEYPPVCEYEMLQFEFRLINENTSDSIVILTQDISHVTFNIEDDFINSGDILTVTVNITNEVNDEISIILFTNIMTDITASTTAVIDFPSSSSLPTTSEPSETIFTMTIIIVIAAGGGLLAVIVLIIIITIISCTVMKKNNKKERSTGTTAVNQIDFSLPPMVTNELYVNPQENVYDFIPNIKNLTPVIKETPSPMSPTTPESDAPLIPPPCDHLFNIPFYSQVCNQGPNNQPLQSIPEDEYVEMSFHPVALRAPLNQL